MSFLDNLFSDPKYQTTDPRKPEELIFRIALRVTQRPAENCVFIDDRPLNLESPRKLGMNVIHYQDAQQLRGDLQKYDVEV